MKTVFLTKWRERLNDPSGIRKYAKKSRPWGTCATGDRVFKELGRRSKNYVSSLSPEAKELGKDFHDAVQDGDRALSQEILEKIEELPTIWKFEIEPEKDPNKPCPHCDNNAKLIMDTENIKVAERVCRFGHPIHVSRCSHGHREEK